MSELALIQQGVEEHPEIIMAYSELVDLREPAQVANALDQLTDIKHRLEELRTILTDVLRLEASKQGTKTLNFDGFAAIISGGTRTEYDGHKLGLLLRAAGLPEDRVQEAVQEIVTYKPNARVLNQLAGANQEYLEIILSCKTIVAAPWRATIKRAVR
jgi:hypothetical protein